MIPNMYAMKATWAHPLDVDWGFMQLQIDDLTLSVNKGANWGGLNVAPYVDSSPSFGESGLAVPHRRRASDARLTRRSMIGVEVAHALIKIDDFFYIEGGFALEKLANVAASTSSPAIGAHFASAARARWRRWCASGNVADWVTFRASTTWR